MLTGTLQRRNRNRALLYQRDPSSYSDSDPRSEVEQSTLATETPSGRMKTPILVLRRKEENPCQKRVPLLVRMDGWMKGSYLEGFYWSNPQSI